jgi:hypothetical protein
MDFYKIKDKNTKNGLTVFPAFQITKSKDIMIQGKAFYAIWNEELGLWSKDEFDVAQIIDNDINEHIRLIGADHVNASYMSDFNSNAWKEWKKYVQLCPANYHQLDAKITFANSVVKKSDYISKRLPYAIEEGSIESYDTLMNTLYSPEEREKIDWAIGAIISGDSKSIQKFLVLYGPGGTGKSTVLNIIDKLFEGYCITFDSRDIVSGTNSFAGDVFGSNPLVALQHEGDLSQIKDNSVLNNIVSHETMLINEKFKSKYEIKLNSFLIMASNKPVKITDAKSGLIRRVIDVHPTGNKLPNKEYEKLMKDILENELGAIANYCLNFYEERGKTYYNRYKPLDMMFETDPFFNFIEDNYDILSDPDGISLKHAYDIYKNYCDETNASFKLQMYKFKAELKNYYNQMFDRYTLDDGTRLGVYYKGFDHKKFEKNQKPVKAPNKRYSWLDLKEQDSPVDEMLKDCPAQYASKAETPKVKWTEVKTVLKDISTKRLHYVQPPDNHIVIDFDLKDEKGNKSLALNLEAAKKFPETYAEVSKGGNGLHLHYIYKGDASELSRLYDEDIEVKVFTGASSLRRKLSICNGLAVATMAAGFLPLREKKKMLDFNTVEDEKHLKNLIKKALNRNVGSGATKPSIDFIYKILDDAYYSGMKYDVSEMFDDIFNFAMNSTNQAQYCVERVSEMKFESDAVDEVTDQQLESEKDESKPIVFYDVEVFPNLFVICWKKLGKDNPIVKMINPKPNEVANLADNFRLVGFNNRRYDNHIIYGRIIGETNAQLFKRSQDIVSGVRGGFAGQAWNLSYTDIYDYSSDKKSLKKWEIELGIHHQELGLPWDKPVPKELWETVADYCCNDVMATEATWEATQGDFLAREILAELTGSSVNDTTNSLSTKFIFGNNKEPQSEFNYRFLGEVEKGHTCKMDDDGITCVQDDGKIIFPGYKYEFGKSSYLDVDVVGEGGYVYSRPGMYNNVWTFDVASMHPSSVIAEELFGPEYTQRFKDILQLRLHIKHKEFDKAKKMFGGALSKYLDDPKKAKSLAQALKIVINSVYGLTSAKFDNAFRDKRNIDNIVAKRGALFMINLRNLVERMGYTVVHIKTDSIKVENPDKKVIKFITDYGKRFGYNFEVEHKFEKICLVNDAVYIAKLAKDDEEWLEDCEKAKSEGKTEPTRWSATGTQFAVPYVFKTLFSQEPIEFKDLCETKSVKSDIYIDMPVPNSKFSEEDAAELIILDKAWHSKAPTALERCAKKLGYGFEEMGARYSKLCAEEEKTHDYRYVGKVGLFCPMKEHGGTLLRTMEDKDGNRKYASVTGAKDYKWLESEMVEQLGYQDSIDISYYRNLVDDAVDTISQYGDFESFVA